MTNIPEGATWRAATILSGEIVVGDVPVWATDDVEEVQVAATAFESLTVKVGKLEFTQEEIDEFWA